MSGPVDRDDAPPDAGRGRPALPELELLAARATEVAGLPVRRALPRIAAPPGPWRRAG